MLTIRMQPLKDDLHALHPHSPIAITLSGSDGKCESGQLLWGLWDLTGLANALKRFSHDLRAKKMIFESMEKPFQIIFERRKHSMVVVFANGCPMESLKEAEASSLFTSALIQFYAEYYHRMTHVDDAMTDLISDTLTTFEDACREFMAERCD